MKEDDVYWPDIGWIIMKSVSDGHDLHMINPNNFGNLFIYQKDHLSIDMKIKRINNEFQLLLTLSLLR